MTHEISSTTSCTTVTRATTLEKTRRIFKIITLESQKKWPLIIKFQLEDEACKNHRLKKRGKGEILFIFDRLFQNTFQHLPLPSPHNIPFNDDSRDETSKKRSSSKEKKKKKRSITFLILARRDPPSSILQTLSNILPLPSQHSLFVRTPQLDPQRFPNIPQHSTCSTKKKKTIPRIHNSILELEPLKSETMNRVTRASNAEEKPGWLTWLPGGQRGGVAGQEGAFTRVQGSGKRR